MPTLAVVKSDYDGLPSEMTSARRWLVWRRVTDEGGRVLKLPFYASGGAREGVLDTPKDIARLASYEEARAALARGGFAGLGFALGPDGSGHCWQGIDIDHLSEHPELASIAADLPGYVERSPSGDGLHAIGFGTAFKNLGSIEGPGAGTEAYSGKRYFTVTGDALGGTVGDLAGFIAERIAPLRKAKTQTTAEVTPLPIVETLATGTRALIRPERGGGAPDEWTARPANNPFHRAVNDASLASTETVERWISAVFPGRAYQSGASWRVSSKSLGRDLQEDLSVHPGKSTDPETGIKDFGTERGMSPIDVVIRDLPISGDNDAAANQAALWLCERIGIDPESLGWNAKAAAAAAQAAAMNAALEEFNQRFFASLIGGVPFVFDATAADIVDGGMRFRGFAEFYGTTKIQRASVASAWLGWENRRSFDRVEFHPGHPFGANDRSFNTWRGLAIEPAGGECRRILAHLKRVWAAGDDQLFRYLICWLALLVQRPHEKPRTALVVRGGEGTGKTIITDLLIAIFGQHGFTASSKDQIVGRFNGHLMDKVLLILEEAVFAGDHAAESTAKTLISNDLLGFEFKGKSTITAPSYAHVIILSNEDWVVPASLDSRRYVVLETSEQFKGDHGYFKALIHEINNGGREAFLHQLLNLDIGNFVPDKIPMTEGLSEQRLQTMQKQDAVRSWWYSTLNEGEFCGELTGTAWSERINTDAMKASYLRFSRDYRNRPIWDHAIKVVKQFLPEDMRDSKQRRTAGDNRERYYRLPPLDEARAIFTKATGLAFENTIQGKTE